MQKVTKNFLALAGLLAGINIIGLFWIHYELIKSPKPTVKIISLSVLPNEDSASKLSLAFDRNMVSSKNVGQPEKASILKLTPEWPGEWIWSATDKIEYNFAEKLPPGRIFRITSTEAFKDVTGRTIEGKDEYEFRTKALSLTRTELVAFDDSDITFRFVFNQPVDPGDLLRHVSFTNLQNGEKLGEPVCLTQTPQEELVIRFPRKGTNRFEMVLDEQLTGYNAELGLGYRIIRSHDIPRNFSLLNIYAGMPNFDEMASVELKFSHKLNLEQKLPEIVIKPAIEKFNASRNDSYLTITGKFKPGGKYEIEVPGTILSADNKTLGENQSMSVVIPEYQTRFQFEYREGILSPLGNLQLDVKAVNVDGLELKAWRVHANNLISHLQNKYDTQATSRLILTKEVKLNLQHNKPRDLMLDINDLIPAKTGIYRINADVTNSRWTEDSVLVTITDLAITSKSERNSSLIWVTSLRTGEPVKDVEVKAITFNNQVLSSEITDSNGLARLKFADNNPDGNMWVITAQKGDDISYLRPDENQWVIDNIEQSGRPFVKNYEVMLYTERGVYRPGETIHLTGIIRGRSGDIPKPFPLVVKVTRPDGRNIAEIIARPLETGQGVFHVDFPTREDAQTGSYQFCITLPGSDDNLGSINTLIECFIPVRMEVTAKTTIERFGPNEPPKIDVSGKYLWDAPAAELPAAITGTLRALNYNSDKYPDYKFGGKINYQPQVLPDLNTNLDANGLAEIQLKLPDSLKTGLYRMQLSATVTETGGRSVSANTSAVLDTLDNHIGIKISSGQVVSIGKPIQVEYVQLTGQDQPFTEGQLKMRLVKVEYDNVMKLVNDRRVWQSVERTIQITEEENLAVSAENRTFEITCTDPGYHRIIINDTQSNSSSTLDFYASQYSSEPQSMPMNQPEILEIITDKEKYLPGQTATVLIRSPIPGRFLLTVENDNVVSEHLGMIENNTAELQIPLSEDSRGSIFFTATVVRAIDPNNKSWLPHRAMGTTRVAIDHTQSEIPVKIIAPDKAEPSENVIVKVETTAPADPNHPALVHLWAVDEGVLLTTSYKTPNPLEFFLGARRLGVSTSDIFMSLLPDYKRPEGIVRIGAGDDYEVNSLRRNPVPAKYRQSAVLWQQAIPVDKNGQINAEFKMPDMIGRIRFMAVVIDHDNYARSEHAMILTSPLIAEASWPRFVSPGDKFEVPVKLFNSTEKSLNVQISTSITGPVELIIDKGLDNIVLEPGQPKTALLNIIAKKTGAVEANVIVSEINSSEKPLIAHNNGTFSIRPATALYSEVKLYSIEAGEQLKIEPSESFIEGTSYMSLSVSARPNVQLGSALQKLIDYPYGCVEQTSSKLLSLLYAPDVFADDRKEMIDSMVKAGIARLWSMQTRSGGLSYWPGSSTPYLWGTAYASSCLLEAKNAGYEIDSQFTSELAEYLEKQLKNIGEDDIDINTKALICRVLAVFDDPPYGWMTRLLEQKEKLDLAGTAHLAAAFNAAGRKDNALALLPEQLPQSFGPVTTSGRLTSPVSQQAAMLSVLLELDPDNPVAAVLARRLNENAENSQWGSTLNNAAVIAALSRYQVMTSDDDPNFSGTLIYKNTEAVQFDHNNLVSHKFQDVNEPVMISSSGTGKIYIIVLTEGLAREGLIKPFDNGIHIERKWFDRHGNPIDINSLHVGDLVNVETSIVTPAQSFDNIAIVDALPGGMEVENPRMATSSNTGDDQLNMPDHVEFLDDRIVLFCSANTYHQTFKYSLRVTTAGVFSVPPIQASCMYEPAAASLGAEGKVIIENK
jgi:alpha-2-macroglobulin